jgi:hypothetical protein
MENQVDEKVIDLEQQPLKQSKRNKAIYIAASVIVVIGVIALGIYYVTKPKLANIRDIVEERGVMREVSSDEPFTGIAQGELDGAYIVGEIENGRYNGTLKYYYRKNGPLLSVSYYNNGNLDRRFIYSENRVLLDEAFFDDGKLSRKNIYYPTGQIKCELNYNASNGDRIFNWWTRDGKNVTNMVKTLYGAWNLDAGLLIPFKIVFTGDELYISGRSGPVTVEYLDNRNFVLKDGGLSSLVDVLSVSDSLISLKEVNSGTFLPTYLTFNWYRVNYSTNYSFVKPDPD